MPGHLTWRLKSRKFLDAEAVWPPPDEAAVPVPSPPPPPLAAQPATANASPDASAKPIVRFIASSLNNLNLETPRSSATTRVGRVSISETATKIHDKAKLATPHPVSLNSLKQHSTIALEFACSAFKIGMLQVRQGLEGRRHDVKNRA